MQQPVGSNIWITPAWLVGILVVACVLVYVVAIVLFKRKISGGSGRPSDLEPTAQKVPPGTTERPSARAS